MDQPGADSSTSVPSFEGDVLGLVEGVLAGSGGTSASATLYLLPRHGTPRLGPGEIIMPSGRVHSVNVVRIGISSKRRIEIEFPDVASSVVEIWAISLEQGTIPRGMQFVQRETGLLPPDPLARVVQQAHEQAELRRTAVEILSTLGSKAPVEPLVAALRDDNRAVRGFAA
jgi:hypothetical protein